jgi:hypothetical protein
MRGLADVVSFAKYAVTLMRTTVAYVRRLAQHEAYIFPIIGTHIVAKIAGRTALCAIGPVPAELPPFAACSSYASVMGAIWGVLVALNRMGTNLAGDCGCTFVESHGDLLYGNAVPQPLFDFKAFGVGQMFVLCHDMFSFNMRPARHYTILKEKRKDCHTKCNRV